MQHSEHNDTAQHFDRYHHWEKIYKSKQINELSWYQPVPETSLEFIRLFNLPLDAKIIDIGGGDSFLADHLLELGFTNITVLDISETALKKAQDRLGDKASQIRWIQADIADFQPVEKYDFWHDRAAFHFLTNDTEVRNYIRTVNDSVTKNGFLVIGTFSVNGPLKCSGIEIKQYSEDALNQLFTKSFEILKSHTIDHITPSGTVQNFIFCGFRKVW